MRSVAFRLLLVLVVCAASLGTVRAAGETIIVQSTTSTANSGLYEHLLPLFWADTGITAYVVAVGTGQALRNARNGDGDVVLVHAREAEEQFVTEGFGVERHDVMANDFVIVGPPTDRARILGLASAAEALTRIARSKARFVSRGDDSGTHKRELALWQTTGIDPSAASGTWYRETGSGMGATLNVAVGMAAYVLTDRGTWISFGNKADFMVLVEGDPDLFNPYGVILVNPTLHPHVNAAAGQRFIDWLVSARGQEAIADYRVHGQQLFFPNAEPRVEQ